MLDSRYKFVLGLADVEGAEVDAGLGFRYLVLSNVLGICREEIERSLRSSKVAECRGFGIKNRAYMSDRA